MKLAYVDIQNFRKLKNCRIEFADKETVFVGANNSGKTSAMDALILFLKRKQTFSTKDFTLSNWKGIETIAKNWVENVDDKPDLTPENWRAYLPTIDIWLDVNNHEIHYVSNLLPTLSWSGGKLGVRLILEIKNIEELYKAYKEAYKHACATCNGRSLLKLWPKNMYHFLEKELKKYFIINAYTLDPGRSDEQNPQKLENDQEPIEGDPFKGLFKIDLINAQRGFSDPNSNELQVDDRRLSNQLQSYFYRHLNPTDDPEESDLDVLEELEIAQSNFNLKLKESFKAPIQELEELNYPGFSDPQIELSTKIDHIQGLKHDAAVQFRIGDENCEEEIMTPSVLPENYNGLGYQNLISMIFNLIRFRDEWMKVGKAAKRIDEGSEIIEPLHIVLIEEPEAHLHAQVQQVFIKKAYEVLRNHSDLKNNESFFTQLIVSTHSSYIAHEIDFKCLRYFMRKPALVSGEVPIATVINLSKVFGSENDTARFASRYLKTTHCDLFFSDAAILIEGPAERMLVPYFIENNYPKLNRCYISVLEIGGSHAHRLRPLVETLGIFTLVITDLDSIEKDTQKKVLPSRGKGYRTGNSTIKEWIPKKESLDEVLDVKSEDKISNGKIRVAYQYEVKLKYKSESKEETVVPYTFEDAIVLSNVDSFREKTGSVGLLKKMVTALGNQTASDACQIMFDSLNATAKKAEMALDLLYSSDPKELITPQYIAEGLKWLEDELTKHNIDYVYMEQEDGVTHE